MKTILILVDGMRPDALTNIESAQRIIAKSTYTMNGQTVVPSVTLPCVISLFHSVNPDRHGTSTFYYEPFSYSLAKNIYDELLYLYKNNLQEMTT